MRKALIALAIVGIPMALVYVFLYLFPKMVEDNNNSNSVLSEKYTTVVGDKVLPNVVVPTSSTSREEQILKYEIEHSSKKNDIFYHDLHINELTNRHTEFYDIKASLPEELHDLMEKNAPLNLNNNKKSIVKVSYNIDWHLNLRQEPGECYFYGADIITDITTVLPNWVGVKEQSSEVQQQWAEYIESSAYYSSKHDSIMEKLSHSLAQKIRFIEKKALCSDLIKTVNELGAKQISNAQAFMQRYQSETGNGRMMGVQVPIFAQGNYIASESSDADENVQAQAQDANALSKADIDSNKIDKIDSKNKSNQ